MFIPPKVLIRKATVCWRPLVPPTLIAFSRRMLRSAHQSAGQTYANGSNQAMGLWNTFVTHTLRQTATNYYVLADGQC